MPALSPPRARSRTLCALALVLGGRFRNLAGRTLRLWFLLPLGLALQLAAVSSGLSVIARLISTHVNLIVDIAA